MYFLNIYLVFALSIFTISIAFLQRRIRPCIRISPTTAILSSSRFKKQKIYSSTEDVHSLSDESIENVLKSFNKLIVSGFSSSEKNFVEEFPFLKLFEKRLWGEITVITDDIKFAKQRLVTPRTVYSGLIDILQFSCVTGQNQSLNESLAEKDTWLAFNVATSDIHEIAKYAISNQIKRLVVGAYVSPEGSEANELIDAMRLLRNAGVVSTFIKYHDMEKMEESMHPYRIVRGESKLPIVEGAKLASHDLYRILVESVDLPKTFYNIYGVGAGNQLDKEILIYMKSQGWSERVQVGLLLGDFMEKIEKRYVEEKDKQQTGLVSKKT